MRYGVAFTGHVMAVDTATGLYKTGDAGNISLFWDKDGANSATTNACAEVNAGNVPGSYKVAMTAAEAQCIKGKLAGTSSTSGVVIIPMEYGFEYGPDSQTFPVGPSFFAGIFDHGIAGAVVDTSHLILRAAGGASFETDALKGKALTILAGTTGKGTSITISGNTNANPPVLSFAVPTVPLTVGDAAVEYIITLQADQDANNLPHTIAPALSAKYGSYTDAQVRALIVTRMLGLTSGLVAGVGNGHQKAPDGTADTLTFTIDANGNVTVLAATLTGT